MPPNPSNTFEAPTPPTSDAMTTSTRCADPVDVRRTPSERIWRGSPSAGRLHPRNSPSASVRGGDRRHQLGARSARRSVIRPATARKAVLDTGTVATAPAVRPPIVTCPQSDFAIVIEVIRREARGPSLPSFFAAREAGCGPVQAPPPISRASISRPAKPRRAMPKLSLRTRRFGRRLPPIRQVQPRNDP